MNDQQNITDAQMEAEFQERNKNLKKTLNNLVDKIDHATESTHNFLGADQTTTSLDRSTHSSSIIDQADVSVFKASGNPDYDVTNSSSNITMGSGLGVGVGGITNRRPSLVREEANAPTMRAMGLDHKLMNSINDDIAAMHSTDPEIFENVASKFDETFGSNALV